MKNKMKLIITLAACGLGCLSMTGCVTKMTENHFKAVWGTLSEKERQQVIDNYCKCKDKEDCNEKEVKKRIMGK